MSFIEQPAVCNVSKPTLISNLGIILIEDKVIKMAVVVEFSIVPLGKGLSISRFLAPGLKELEDRGVRHEVTPMCTIFEAKSVEEAFDVVKAAHEAVFRADVKRVLTTVKIDERRDIERGMEEKVKSLKRAVRKS